jgi:hypothetical protein
MPGFGRKERIMSRRPGIASGHHGPAAAFHGPAIRRAGGARKGASRRLLRGGVLLAAVLLAAAAAPAQQGLMLGFYAGQHSTTLVDPLANLLALTPTWTAEWTGAIDYPTVSSALGLPQNANYALLWTGWFFPPAAGTYDFQTGSDDGSVIYIDLNDDGVFSSPDERVVNNNYYQATTWRSGSVTLAARPYHIAIAYYQGTGGEELHAQYRLPGSQEWLTVASASGYFFATGSPIIQNLSATNGTPAAATIAMRGLLVSTGTSATAVSVCWDTVDRGVGGDWAHSHEWPAPQAPGEFGFQAEDLPPESDCWYTFKATNDSGVVWAMPSECFITGETTVEATKGTGRTDDDDPLFFTLSRPASCAGAALPLRYTLGGTATVGVHYTISPADGMVTLAAGETSAVVTVTSWRMYDAEERTVILALAPGPYAIGAAGAATGTLAAVTDGVYWDGGTADWTLPAHWLGDPPGLLPANGATGIVAVGTAVINQPAGDLYDAADQSPPAEIVIRAGGTVLYNRPDGVSIANHNFVLAGGIFAAVGRLYAAGAAYDHGLAVRSPSVIETRYEWRPGPWTLRGGVRDYDADRTGRLTLRLPGGEGGNGGMILAAPNASFRGGWLLDGGGSFRVQAPGAAGSGDIVATNGAAAVWCGGDDAALPGIVIDSGCAFLLAADGRYNTLPGKAIVLRDGATFGASNRTGGNWQRDMHLEAPLHVSGDITLLRDCYWNLLHLEGDIVSDGPAVITRRGEDVFNESGLFLGRENSSYAGDWIVSDAGAGLGASNDGALGTGRVELRAGTFLPVTRDLALRNMIGGDGTLGSAGRTVTLRPCRRDGVSTPAGIAPGAGWGAAVGTLSVAGGLAFASLEDGGDVVRCKLLIDVTGPAEAVTNDLLAVAGDLAGLDAVDLHVTLSGVAAAALGGRPLVFLRAANAQDPAAFHSVVPPPGASVAVTAEGLPAGSLGLLIRSAGTLMLLR